MSKTTSEQIEWKATPEWKYMREVIAERDAAVAALKHAEDLLSHDLTAGQDDLRQIRAAIAAAEKGQ